MMPYTLTYTAEQYILMVDVMEDEIEEAMAAAQQAPDKTQLATSLQYLQALAQLSGKLSANQNSIVLENEIQVQAMNDLVEHLMEEDEWEDYSVPMRPLHTQLSNLVRSLN